MPEHFESAADADARKLYLAIFSGPGYVLRQMKRAPAKHFVLVNFLANADVHYRASVACARRRETLSSHLRLALERVAKLKTAR